MLLYISAAFMVCLTGYTGAQYYSNQPPRGYPAPAQPQQQPPPQPQGQRNSEAWRRWYYQQRQQQQQSTYSAPRGRQPPPVASPAASSQSYYSNQRPPAPTSSQYSQQYYQQRPQPPAGYNQQQGYAQQPPYNGYQQPNYRPPPATPAPPTTPAELQSAFGARSSADVLNSLIDLVSSAVQRTPISARQTQILNRGRQVAVGRNQAMNFGQTSMLGSPASALLQQRQLDRNLLAVLGQKAGSNVGIGTSAALNNASPLLTRFNQRIPNPYSYPGGISALRRVPGRANLNYAFPNGRTLPWIGRNTQAARLQLATAKATPAPPAANTTTPGVPVATEPLEYEGPTTTAVPRFKQAAAVNLFQAKIASRSRSLPGNKSVPAPVQQPVSPPVGQPVFGQPVNQMLDYPPQPYHALNPPPGFISIEAFRAEIMAAINILTNEIAAMANSSEVSRTTTPSTSKLNKQRELELLKAKKLAALPGGLSFLVGKFASKLTPKVSSDSKAQSYVSQSSQGHSISPPKKSYPPSEYAGIFDLTPQQLQDLKNGRYSRRLPLAVPTPPPQFPPQEMLHTTLATPQAMDLYVPPHQQHQPPQDLLLQPSGNNPPPEQFLGPTTAGYIQQGNQSYMFEQQQPPPFDPHQQGPPNLPMEPHPFNVPGQQPWQQSPPPGYQQPLDFQGPPQAPYEPPPPPDFTQGGPPPPMWREPPPQQPNFNSQNQYLSPPQLEPINQNPGPQNPPPQPPQPSDMPWQQQPGPPQEFPPPPNHQQPPPTDLQWPPPQQPQPPPVQDYAPPYNNPPPMFEQQPQPIPGEYHHHHQPPQPQRPPPLDISNYQPSNSQFQPPPPQPPPQEFIPPMSGPPGVFDPPPQNQAPWSPPVDLGGANPAFI